MGAETITTLGANTMLKVMCVTHDETRYFGAGCPVGSCARMAQVWRRERTRVPGIVPCPFGTGCGCFGAQTVRALVSRPLR
eukprot:1093801-Prymnesium_polylepis.2